eukprot:snap_masked-scaffold_17-processed-gene-0.18-mRNA-1 protein AED:1.00 eAED:1.00 QI:0/0/0/0/1/1/3/0/79
MIYGLGIGLSSMIYVVGLSSMMNEVGIGLSSMIYVVGLSSMMNEVGLGLGLGLIRGSRLPEGWFSFDKGFRPSGVMASS